MIEFLKKYNVSFNMADCYKRKNDTLEACMIEIFLRSRGWSTWYSEDYWVHPDMVDPGKDHTQRGTSLRLAFIYEICDLKNKTRSLKEIRDAADIETLFMEKVNELFKRNTTKEAKLRNQV